MIDTFLSLKHGDQIRLVIASALLLIVHAGLVVLSLSRMRGLLLSASSGISRIIDSSPPIGRVVWAVKLADHKIPGDRSCLVRSTTAEALLRAYDYTPTHRIGVAKDDQGAVKAHSWLEHDERVLIGDLPDLSKFQPLPPLEQGDEQ